MGGYHWKGMDQVLCTYGVILGTEWMLRVSKFMTSFNTFCFVTRTILSLRILGSGLPGGYCMLHASASRSSGISKICANNTLLEEIIWDLKDLSCTYLKGFFFLYPIINTTYFSQAFYSHYYPFVAFTFLKIIIYGATNPTFDVQLNLFKRNTKCF